MQIGDDHENSHVLLCKTWKNELQRPYWGDNTLAIEPLSDLYISLPSFLFRLVRWNPSKVLLRMILLICTKRTKNDYPVSLDRTLFRNAKRYWTRIPRPWTAITCWELTQIALRLWCSTHSPSFRILFLIHHAGSTSFLPFKTTGQCAIISSLLGIISRAYSSHQNWDLSPVRTP